MTLLTSFIEHGLWPVAVVSLVLLFRTPIEAFLVRARKATLPGGITVEVSGALEEQSKARTNITPDGGAAANFVARFLPDSDYIRNLEREVTKHVRGDLPAENKIEYLTNYVAHMIANFCFERTNRLIFGSQLQFVHHLGTTPGGMTEGEVLTWYHSYAPQNGIPFEKWAEFLHTSQLVVIDPNTGRKVVSPFGREFLQWQVREGVATPHPF